MIKIIRQTRVMEPETIQKNRVRPKKLLICGMMLFALELTISVLTSCGKNSPIEPDDPGAIPVTGISLNQTNLTLNKGQTYTLTATVSPDNATNKNVTWSSSDVSKVSINNSGVITAVATGTATITATAEGKTATCKVTVSESTTEIPIQSITLDYVSTYYNKSNATSINLFSGYIGGTDGGFNVTVKPDNATNKEVTWTSSNTSVAEVKVQGFPVSHTIYVNGKGTATLTAKAGDKTATCTVNVLDIDFGYNSLRDIELVVGEEYAITAMTHPNGQPVTLASSNPSRATVEGDGYGKGKITAKSSGTLNINATYQGQTISWNVTIYDLPLADITVDGVTWAARNVNAPGAFAGKASDLGMFYQWDSRTGYSSQQGISTYSTGNEWSTANDPSPTGYRIPTVQEAQSLTNKTKSIEWNNPRLALVNGNYYNVYKFDNEHLMVLPNGDYWTATVSGATQAYTFSTAVPQTEYYSYGLDMIWTTADYRNVTKLVRCVKK